MGWDSWAPTIGEALAPFPEPQLALAARLAPLDGDPVLTESPPDPALPAGVGPVLGTEPVPRGNRPDAGCLKGSTAIGANVIRRSNCDAAIRRGVKWWKPA
jgi:hypothetical protein